MNALYTLCTLYAGGLNHLPYLSISVSMAVIKDFLTNYMKALGLNHAYNAVKIIIYSVNMFNWIDNGKYITAINKKFIRFFLYLDTTDDFWLILKTILKITTFCGF